MDSKMPFHVLDDLDVFLVLVVLLLGTWTVQSDD